MTIPPFKRMAATHGLVSGILKLQRLMLASGVEPPPQLGGSGRQPSTKTEGGTWVPRAIDVAGGKSSPAMYR